MQNSFYKHLNYKRDSIGQRVAGCVIDVQIVILMFSPVDFLIPVLAPPPLGEMELNHCSFVTCFERDTCILQPLAAMKLFCFLKNLDAAHHLGDSSKRSARKLLMTSQGHT